jgi:hypothetical protein
MNIQEQIKTKVGETVRALMIERQNDNSVTSHVNADAILCDFLTFLGYSEITEAYAKIEKCYDLLTYLQLVK